MQTTGRFTLNGKEIDAPLEVVNSVGDSGAFIESSFGVENVQPAISPLRFTFQNEAAQILRDYVKQGNIFKGVPFTAEVIGDAGIIDVMNGLVDLTDEFEEINEVLVSAKVKFRQSTLSLEDRIASINLDLLYDKGFLTDSHFTNVDYVVEKPVNLVEVAVLSVSLYLMVKELQESIEKLKKDADIAIGILTGSATGANGSTTFLILTAVTSAAYTSIMLVTVINLMEDLITKFISPVRKIKSLKYKTVLEQGFKYMGFGFESDIADLENFVYVPSIKGKPNINGLPNPMDYGYNFGEMVALMRSQFKAKIGVLNNTIHFKSESSDFWKRNSIYVMPDVLLDENNPKGYNTSELTKSRMYRYETDISDNWTLDNYKGTQYTIITEHTEEVSDLESNLKGFSETVFPVCLGHRKENLNAIEIALQVLAATVDLVIKAFGGTKTYSQAVARRVGMLKISHEETSKPKCIYYTGSMPSNHRDLTSAKYLYNSYLNFDSFVLNNFNRQRIIYEGVEVPFGLSDYVKTTNNSYFYTERGERGKFINIKWDWESDLAICDFYIEKVYTTKLKETFIERE